MNSDSDEDIMVDDWLTAKQDLLDTSDEELNDDLLRSDEENETMRCQNDNVSQPKLQAIAKPFLVCRTSHLAKEQATCAKEEQTEIEVDPGEVLDIEINAPSGDEFQSGAELQEVQAAPEEPLNGPCCSAEPRFPGQHMFDQQHPASVLDTNPLLAGPSPKGFLQPPGYESDPWRPSPSLQGPVGPSKRGSPHSAYDLFQNHSSAQSVSFTAPSGPRAQKQKPAVLVRAVARMGSKAKPMAVARGMPIAAKQPASAKSTVSAKTPPALGMVRRNVGQKVKEEPQTPPALQKLPVTPLNIKNNEECGDEDELYRQRLKKQIQLRKEICRQKEQRRRLRAINKNQRPGHPQTDSQRCWRNNQHQQKHPFTPPGPHIPQIEARSCTQKVTYEPSSHNPPLCSVLNPHPEYQPVPQQHQYHVLLATPQLPWQQPSAAQVSSSGRAAELEHNHPHLLGTDKVVFPDHSSLDYGNAWASQAQDVWKGGRKMLRMRDSDIPVPAKIRVVKHFNPSAGQEGAQSNLTPQMNEDFRTEIKTKSRVVTFTRPGSFLQRGPRWRCTNHTRVSSQNQFQLKVPVRENEGCAFIPFSSGVSTESVAAQSNVNFIVRLNH